MALGREGRGGPREGEPQLQALLSLEAAGSRRWVPGRSLCGHTPCFDVNTNVKSEPHL